MRELRKLLLPLSWIYGSILSLRHFLYDSKILKSYVPSQKTIVVGNLSLGGTGKTPMVDYLISILGTERVAVLSRGYGRATKGTIMVHESMEAGQCGDEPLLLKKKHPDLFVMVDEDRARGLESLRTNHSQIETVILDDAMQHRKIKANFYLLLTTWEKPFSHDFLLPAGNLRDTKSRSKSAQAIVVTKSPENPDPGRRKRLIRELGTGDQHLFFSSISYGDLCQLDSDMSDSTIFKNVVLLTAIANPAPFELEARKHFSVLKHFKFYDHHLFRPEELFRLRDFIDTFVAEKPVLLTTEKDAQRLKPHASFFKKSHIRVVYWKIKTDFGDDAERFNSMIRSI